MMTDIDYEQWQARPYLLRFYDWTRRCWRVVVATGLWPGKPATAADPETLIDASGNLFRAYNQGKAKALVNKFETALREHGPMTARALADLCQYNDDRTRKYMDRNPDIFLEIPTGRVPAIWGLVGVHEGWQPPALDYQQRVLEILRQHGELSTSALAAHAVTYRVLRTMQASGLVRRRLEKIGGAYTNFWSVMETTK